MRVTELQREIELERKRVEASVLEEVRTCIEEFGFTPAQVFAAGSKKSTVRKAKYFDPSTGATWSGRGKPPVWIRGKDRREFELPPAQEE